VLQQYNIYTLITGFARILMMPQECCYWVIITLYITCIMKWKMK